MQLVHRDGKTIGEIRVEGSTVVMKGYLEDEEATGLAFEGGWFHTGVVNAVVFIVMYKATSLVVNQNLVELFFVKAGNPRLYPTLEFCKL